MPWALVGAGCGPLRGICRRYLAGNDNELALTIATSGLLAPIEAFVTVHAPCDVG